MKAILMSIRPEWVSKTLNGEKTIEIRKTAPKCELPITVYIYCTKGKLKLFNLCNDAWVVAKEKDIEKFSEYSGKVIAKFTFGKINEKRNIVEGIEQLKWTEQIPNIKYGNGEKAYIDGYINTEPFYNGKVSTIKASYLTQKELIAYGKGKPLYAWHISDLQIFDKPMKLGEFYKPKDKNCEYYQCDDGFADCPCDGMKIKRPPQSWQFVEVTE